MLIDKSAAAAALAQLKPQLTKVAVFASSIPHMAIEFEKMMLLEEIGTPDPAVAQGLALAIDCAAMGLACATPVTAADDVWRRRLLENFKPRYSGHRALRAMIDIALAMPVAKHAASAARAASDTVTIYAAGAPHLGVLARQLGVHILKIGATTQHVLKRMDGLRRTGYAGLWGTSPTTLVPLVGADQWAPYRLKPCHVPDGLRFVALTTHGNIEIKVPSTLNRAVLDEALHHVLAARALSSFLHSDAGRVRCAQQDVDPDGWFWTRYPAERGVPARLSRVRELYVLHPEQDLAMLMTTLDALAAHWAGITPPRAS